MTRRKTDGQETTLIFLHIPKSGGTTLHNIIEQNYEPSTIFTIKRPSQPSIAEFKKLPIERRRKLKVVKGHYTFGLHEHIPQLSTYITMLRNPVDRVISSYYMVVNDLRHPLHKKVISENITLRDYVNNNINEPLNNGQVKSLCGVPGDAEHFKCSLEMLETAKHNLKNYFSFVGLTERYDESLISIKRAFGWKLPLYEKRNVTKKKPLKEDISKDTIKLIEKNNIPDIELYQFVKDSFETFVAEQSQSFHAAISFFRFANALYSNDHLPLPLRITRRIVRPFYRTVRSFTQ